MEVVVVVVVGAHDLVCLAVLPTAPLSVPWEWGKGASVCFQVLTSGRVQWQSLHLPFQPQLWRGGKGREGGCPCPPLLPQWPQCPPLTK